MSPPTTHVLLCHHIHELKVLEWFCPVPLGIGRATAIPLLWAAFPAGWGLGGTRPPVSHPTIGAGGGGGVHMPQELLSMTVVFLPSFLRISLLIC